MLRACRRECSERSERTGAGRPSWPPLWMFHLQTEPFFPPSSLLAIRPKNSVARIAPSTWDPPPTRPPTPLPRTPVGLSLMSFCCPKTSESVSVSFKGQRWWSSKLNDVSGDPSVPMKQDVCAYICSLIWAVHGYISDSIRRQSYLQCLRREVIFVLHRWIHPTLCTSHLGTS